MRGKFTFSLFLCSSLWVAGVAAEASFANSKVRRPPPPKSAEGDHSGAPAHGTASHGQGTSAGSAEVLTYKAPEGWQELGPQKGYIKTFSKIVDDPEVYRASIQIRREAGPHPIDQIFLDETKEHLVHKIANSGSQMDRYTVRSGELLTLDSGRKAILIYADFNLRGEEMMHQHFIISSADNHYYLTYTDTKAEMENPGVGTTASQVFESFTTVDLPSMAPGRFKWPIRLGVGLFVLIALGMIIQKVKGRKYNDSEPSDSYAEDEGFGDNTFTAQVKAPARAHANAAQPAAVQGQPVPPVPQQVPASPEGSQAGEVVAHPAAQPPAQAHAGGQGAGQQPAKPAKPAKKSWFGRKSKANDYDDDDLGEFSATSEMPMGASELPLGADSGIADAGQPMLTEEPFTVSSQDFSDEGEDDDWNLADTEKTKIS